ncbi:FAD/NAD(P)-binding domain-containing protein [Thozetella sp. PMI_491]|nr:FAD/NAD(P)-binding domain-containing protein [Thozetella sp. PMI_491]
MTKFKVIIIGGGLSGSLLANGLLNNGVDFVLYERDSEDTERKGYQIRLGEGAMTGFAGCLDEKHLEKIIQKFGKSFGVSQTAPSLYNSRFEQCLDLSKIPSYSKTAAINRVVLRDMLLEPVKEKGHVKFGKSFTEYEMVEEGSEKVKVHFQDGTSDTCDVLIGADGSRSKIGLNNLVHLDKYWSFMSKGRLPYDRMMEMPAQLRRGPIIMLTNSSALFYSLYLPPAQDNKTSEDTNSISYNEEEASFFWGLSIPAAKIPGGDATKVQDKRQLCLDHIKNWAPEYTQMLSAGAGDDGAEDIYVTQARASIRPSKNWRRTCQKSGDARKGNPRVWLVGDAMHSMQPNRGQGGNQSLADCAEVLPSLVKLSSIAKSGKVVTTSEVFAACQVYEDLMIPRAFTWVKKSGGAKHIEMNLDGWMGTLVKVVGGMVVKMMQLYHQIFKKASEKP